LLWTFCMIIITQFTNICATLFCLFCITRYYSLQLIRFRFFLYFFKVISLNSFLKYWVWETNKTFNSQIIDSWNGKSHHQDRFAYISCFIFLQNCWLCAESYFYLKKWKWFCYKIRRKQKLCLCQIVILNGCFQNGLP
jgi:hypothetical protein